MVKQFDKCCCAANLRTGTIIIGSLGLIGGVYYTIEALLRISSSKNNKGHEMPGGTVSQILAVIMGIVNIILCILLIVGAVKRNAKMVYPWIIASVVMLVVFIIVNVASGIYACVAGLIAGGLILIFVAAIIALIQVYFILIVNSFYTTLKNGEPVATQPA